ncbi:metallophosphoesterase [Bradyrhizobium symbiodeficiens]|uniref:metallophosphoesterase n=1 Tax=Bradyrhizobium symbiodeficiens TaxID=1404367 RepID=UPI0030CF83D5
MATFFLADTHYFHASPDKPDGIIRLAGRPFANGRDMNEAMAASHRALVKPGDDVMFLGDFAHRADPDALRRLFDALPGRKHLIIGNHDTKASGTLDLPWESIRNLAFVSVDGARLVLCHFALRSWPGIRRGALMLFGHHHGRLPGNSQSMDIGVDVMGFAPVRLSQIKQRLAQLPPLVDPEAGDHLENDGVTP